MKGEIEELLKEFSPFEIQTINRSVENDDVSSLGSVR
jgi:hypothetical protein